MIPGCPKHLPVTLATGSLLHYFAHIVSVKFAHPHLLIILTEPACHYNSFWRSRCDNNHVPTISLKPCIAFPAISAITSNGHQVHPSAISAITSNGHQVHPSAISAITSNGHQVHPSAISAITSNGHQVHPSAISAITSNGHQVHPSAISAILLQVNHISESSC